MLPKEGATTEFQGNLARITQHHDESYQRAAGLPNGQMRENPC